MAKSSLMGRPVYIVDGARTPFIKAMGKPGQFHASDLGFHATRALLSRLPISPSDIDQTIVGCVGPGPNEANIGRIIALRAGCNENAPAWTVQRNCASGMQALDSAALEICSGRSNLVLAGGTEAMSRHPVLLNDLMLNWLAAWSRAKTASARGKTLMKLRGAYLKPIISLLRGLTDPVVGLSMGQTAEELAYKFAISRKEMDQYAADSHSKLGAALENKKLDEVVPIYDISGNVYETDEGFRADTTIEKLANLRPVFDRNIGSVTAGNSAQVTDGAAMVLLASEEAIKKFKLPILGQLLDSEWAGLSPTNMGLGPVHAMAPIMARNGYDSSDIDYWEINEAFAAQVLACLSAWKNDDYCTQELNQNNAFQAIDTSRLNVDGGGISLGHPVGASGARIVLHLLKTLQDKQAKRGMASLCIGGGQGGAMLLERV